MTRGKSNLEFNLSRFSLSWLWRLHGYWTLRLLPPNVISSLTTLQYLTIALMSSAVHNYKISPMQSKCLFWIKSIYHKKVGMGLYNILKHALDWIFTNMKPNQPETEYNKPYINTLNYMHLSYLFESCSTFFFFILIFLKRKVLYSKPRVKMIKDSQHEFKSQADLPVTITQMNVFLD